MSSSETERFDAPEVPHAQKQDSNKQVALAFGAELPHMQKLLSLQPQGNDASATRPVSGNSNEIFLGSVLWDRRHPSPWAKANPDAKDNSSKSGKDASAKNVEAGKVKPSAGSAEAGDGKSSSKKTILPELTLVENKVPETKTQEAKAQEAKVKEQQPEAPKPVIPSVIEGAHGTRWKQEGSQWNFYDRQGQKVDKYEGKASEVTRDADGNNHIKLSDGRTITEKKDGSTLEYDSKNQLKTITYPDGSTRKFQWDGNELAGMTSKTGDWTRLRDESGKLKNEWAPKGQTTGWQGELSVDQKTGEFISGPTRYRSDLSVEKVNNDGTREVTYPNKDQLKIGKNGQISEINYADGSKRTFSWTENPNAKGSDDKYTLTGIQVSRDGNTYYHMRQDDGKWNCYTWENGKWSQPQPESNAFTLNSKTGDYSYTDSSTGITTIRQPNGIEKNITKEGASLEYKDGSLSSVTINGKTREFETQDKKLVAIHDDIQGKNWKPSADGGWVSDKGDKRQGQPVINASGEIEFRKGDKSEVIKLDGKEYTRIANPKDGSQVDIAGNQVQVKAGDGSSRVFTTGADGKEVIKESVTRNGKTESWTRGERLASGNYTWSNDQDPSKREERGAVTQQDGKLAIEYPDGKKFQSSTSGTERIENSKEGWYREFRDGRPSENKYPDGTIRKFTFDGPSDSPKTLEIIPPDGKGRTLYTKVSEGVYSYEDGKQKWNANISVSKEGTYKFVDNDDKGKTTTRLIDGHMTVENPADKSRVEKFNNEITKVIRDGKAIEVVRDRNNAPVELKDEASNTSYKKNEKGEWVSSAIDASKPFSKDDLLRKGDVSIDESGKVNFIAADGQQISQNPGEKAQLINSKEKSIEACLNNASMTDEQKARLRKNIEDFSSRTDITAKDKAVFQESLAKIAARQDISDKEKADTYSQLGRLLESKSNTMFKAAERAQLAEQLVWHIANPGDNAQGANPNCQVTVIRGKLLYEKPSQFARMMTDVITTGQFVTKDGSTIKVPAASVKVGKGSEESTFPPQDGTRSWMGKISDVTCANIHWQRQSHNPRGEYVGPGQLVYNEEPPTGRKDTGGRIHREPGDGYRYEQTDTAGNVLKTPNLYTNDIADVYKQIAGPTSTVVVGAPRNEIKAGSGVAVVTEDQLHGLLSREKGVHVAQIWTGTDWVWDEPNRKAGITPKDSGHDEHVVLIKDYDPITKTVAVDNSWSSIYDHTAPDRRITLHELYLAMSKQK